MEMYVNISLFFWSALFKQTILIIVGNTLNSNLFFIFLKFCLNMSENLNKILTSKYIDYPTN